MYVCVCVCGFCTLDIIMYILWIRFFLLQNNKQWYNMLTYFYLSISSSSQRWDSVSGISLPPLPSLSSLPVYCTQEINLFSFLTKQEVRKKN